MTRAVVMSAVSEPTAEQMKVTVMVLVLPRIRRQMVTGVTSGLRRSKSLSGVKWWPAGAGNPVTAVDLGSLAQAREAEFGRWLRGAVPCRAVP